MDPWPPADVRNNLTYVTVSSNDSYFMHQASRAGLLGYDLRRIDYMRDAAERELVQHEIEKERIRDEIIAMELARKRAIEVEIRRELLLEREFAMQRPGRYQLMAPPGPSTSSTMMHYQYGGFGGYGGKIDERMPPLGRLETGTFNRLLFQHPPEVAVPEVNLPFRRHPEVAVSEVKASFQRPPEPTMPEFNPIPQATIGKLLILPKPLNPNLSGTKRKASAARGPSKTKASKKKKGEKSNPQKWTCKLCQVSSTSEQGLKDHLRGKKHKAKSSRMRETKGKIFQGKKSRRNGKRRQRAQSLT